MTDDQLLHLASDGGLTDEAAIALRSEMATRRLTSQAMSSYKSDLLESKRTQLEQANYSGICRLFGRKVISQSDTTHDIVIRTKWFAPRGLPLFPVGSYRYSRKRRTIGTATSIQEELIDRVPLNWGQVLRTGALSYGLVILTMALIVLWAEWQNKTHGR